MTVLAMSILFKLESEDDMVLCEWWAPNCVLWFLLISTISRNLQGGSAQRLRSKCVIPE
jgi:hypothetical protein